MQGTIGFQLGAALACALMIPLAPGARAQDIAQHMTGAARAAPPSAVSVKMAANGASGGGAAANSQVSASASANASGAASANAGDGAGSCNAQSSAEAETDIGGQVIRKSARRQATRSGQGCTATAQSSASVQADPQGGEASASAQ